MKHRVVEVRADTVGKLDRAEHRSEAEVNLTPAMSRLASGPAIKCRTRSLILLAFGLVFSMGPIALPRFNLAFRCFGSP